MQSRNRNIVFLAALGAIVISILVVWSRRERATAAVVASASTNPPVLWDAPRFQFTDQNGIPLTKEGIIGHAWIANFIFTQCTSICPTMSARMVMLQRRLRSPDLRFISFSVDPKHDDEPTLARYASTFGAVDPRWLLARTDKVGLMHVTNGMRVTMMETLDAKNPIVHSNRFFLVDAEGRVRGTYDSDDEEALLRLEADAALLDSRGTNPAPLDRSSMDGATLVHSLGCNACHMDERLAPPLAGVANRTIRLEGNVTIQGDVAYMRESILDPHARLVAGYGPTMPSYRSVLSDADIDIITQYLSSLAPVPPASAPNAPTTQPLRAVDPICGMDVNVRAATPKAHFEGRDYYFCCEGCRDEFEANPRAALKQ